MPTELPARPPGSVLAVVVSVALALYVVVRMVLDRDPSTCPTAEIRHNLDVIGVELAAVWLILRKRGGSAAERAGLIGLVAVAMWPLLCLFSMHADSARWWLVDWHVVLSAWLVVFALGRGVIALVRG